MRDDDDELIDEHETADDALEEERAGRLFNPKYDEETLEEDNASPASPPDDVGYDGPAVEPEGDTDEDADEVYDEGEKEASTNSDRIVNPDDRPQPLEPED